MIQTLRTRIAESEHPVGVKKTSNWKLPPVDFVYGKKNKEDKEGASISKYIKANKQLHVVGKFMLLPKQQSHLKILFKSTRWQSR